MQDLDLTTHWAGIASLVIFVAAYVLVVFEEATHMRKSKPVVMAAGLIWGLIGVAYAAHGMGEVAHEHAVQIIAEYGELFLFLLVAITYVNTLEERRAGKAGRVETELERRARVAANKKVRPPPSPTGTWRDLLSPSFSDQFTCSSILQ